MAGMFENMYGALSRGMQVPQAQGIGMLGQGLPMLYAAYRAGKERDEDRRALKRINFENEKPEDRYNAMATYYTEKGDVDNANKYLDQAQQEVKLNLRKAELADTKEARASAEKWKQKQYELELKKIDVMNKQYMNAGEKGIAAIESVAAAEKKYRDEGNPEMADKFKAFGNDLAGIKAAAEIKPPKRDDIIEAAAMSMASLTLPSEPDKKISDILDKNQLGAFTNAVGNYAEAIIAKDPKMDKNVAIKKAYDVMVGHIKKPSHMPGMAKNFLSDLTGGWISPSSSYTFNLADMSEETKKNLFGSTPQRPANPKPGDTWSDDEYDYRIGPNGEEQRKKR